MEEYAELRAQRLVGACKSGRPSPHAHLRASGRSGTPGAAGKRVLAGNRARARRSRSLRRACSFSFPVLDESPRLLPGELPAVPDLSPNSRAVQIAIARLPFPAAGLSRRKASARTLCSPSASVTGPCPLSALPVTGAGGAVPPALVCWFSLCLVKGKHIRPFQTRRKHTMAHSTFNRETNWRIITS